MQWWQWLLVITAAFVLSIVIVIYGAYSYIRYKLRQFGKSLGDAFKSFAGGPLIPQTIKLIRATPEHLKDRVGLDDIVASAKSLGLQVDGPFQSEQDYTGDLVLYTLADPARSVAGMVLASKAKGVIYDFVTEYADGLFATHTTLADQGREKPDWMKNVRMPGVSQRELLDEHLAQRPQKPMAVIQLADVPERAKFVVEEEYFWRATRGGLTDAEIDRQLANQPDPNADDASMSPEDRRRAMQQSRQMVVGMVRGQAASFLQEKFHEKLLQSLTITPAEWEKIEDRLVFVFDAAEPDSLAYHVEPPERKQLAGPDEDEESDGNDEPEERVTPAQAALRRGPIRQVFAELNAALEPARQLQTFSTVDVESRFSRASADVYISPADESSDDD